MEFEELITFLHFRDDSFVFDPDHLIETAKNLKVTESQISDLDHQFQTLEKMRASSLE